MAKTRLSKLSTLQRAGALAVMCSLCFAAGAWWGSRPAHDEQPAGGGRRGPDADVELRLDAGAVSLLPDAALHLRPIPPLDADVLLDPP